MARQSQHKKNTGVSTRLSFSKPEVCQICPKVTYPEMAIVKYCYSSVHCKFELAQKAHDNVSQWQSCHLSVTAQLGETPASELAVRSQPGSKNVALDTVVDFKRYN